MSKSFHTDPPEIIADRRHARDAEGRAALPRLIERKPYPGDVHPLNKKVLRGALRRVPEKYLYGLAQIELRARSSDIGHPFGVYLPDEKAILLYSLPEVWHLPRAGSWLLNSLHRFYADVREVEDGLEVRWPEEGFIAVWFFYAVLAHELGHHYAEQYRRKNRQPVGVVHEEIVAGLHARRIFSEQLEKRRKAPKPT